MNAQERYDELLEHLDRAMKVKGVSKSFIYNELALVYEIKGGYDESVSYYKQAIKYSQNDESIKGYEASIARVEKKKTMQL